MARVAPPAVRVLRCDPFAPLVAALEVFDDASQTADAGRDSVRAGHGAAGAAARCRQRRRMRSRSVSTPGSRRAAEIARLLGVRPEDARAQLGELVYHDPAREQLVAAAEYLSGNVRVKLDLARAAARRDPALEVNVAALRARRAAGADGRGDRAAPGCRVDRRRHPSAVPGGAAGGPIDSGRASRRRDLGSQRQQLLCEGHQRVGYRPHARTGACQGGARAAPDPGDRRDRRRRTHPAGRQPDRDRGRAGEGPAMQERFADWCWEQPDRAGRLAGEYNRRFNSLVLRDYTIEGAAAHAARPGAHVRAA